MRPDARRRGDRRLPAAPGEGRWAMALPAQGRAAHAWAMAEAEDPVKGPHVTLTEVRLSPLGVSVSSR